MDTEQRTIRKVSGEGDRAGAEELDGRPHYLARVRHSTALVGRRSVALASDTARGRTPWVTLILGCAFVWLVAYIVTLAFLRWALS